MVSSKLRARDLQPDDFFEQKYKNRWLRGYVVRRPKENEFIYLSEGEPFPKESSKRSDGEGKRISGINLTHETPYNKDDDLIKIVFSNDNNAKANFDAMRESTKNTEGFWSNRFIVMHARHAINPENTVNWTYPAIETGGDDQPDDQPGADYFRGRFALVCESFKKKLELSKSYRSVQNLIFEDTMCTRNMSTNQQRVLQSVEIAWKEMLKEKNIATEFAKREMNWLWLASYNNNEANQEDSRQNQRRQSSRLQNPVTRSQLIDGVYDETLAFSGADQILPARPLPSPSGSAGTSSGRGFNSPMQTRRLSTRIAERASLASPTGPAGATGTASPASTASYGARDPNGASGSRLRRSVTPQTEQRTPPSEAPDTVAAAAAQVGSPSDSSGGQDNEQFEIIDWKLEQNETNGLYFNKMNSLFQARIKKCTYVLLTLRKRNSSNSRLVKKTLYDFFYEDDGYEVISAYRKNNPVLMEYEKERKVGQEHQEKWYFRENYMRYEGFSGYKGLKQGNKGLYPAIVFGSVTFDDGDDKYPHYGVIVHKDETEANHTVVFYNRNGKAETSAKDYEEKFKDIFVKMAGNKQILAQIRREAGRREPADDTSLRDSIDEDDDLRCSISDSIRAGSVIGEHVRSSLDREEFPIMIKYAVAPDKDANLILVLKVVAYGYDEAKETETLCCDFGHYFAKVNVDTEDKEFINACPRRDGVERILRDPSNGSAQAYGRFRFFKTFSNVVPLLSPNRLAQNAFKNKSEKDEKIWQMCKDNKDRDIFNQNMLLRAYCQSRDRELRFSPMKTSGNMQTKSFISAWLNHGLLRKTREILNTDTRDKMKNAKQSLGQQDKTVQQLAEEYKRLLQRILKSAFDVHLAYRVTEAKVIQEDDFVEEDLEAGKTAVEPDLYANEEPEGFPFLSDMTFHWSNIATTTVTVEKRDPILSEVAYTQVYAEDDEKNVLSFSRVFSAADVDGDTNEDIRENLADLLDVELNPELDEFRSLVESSLLVRGQTSSLYSYLGSRAHFRASMLLAKTTRMNDGKYATENEVLFGPHLTYGNLKYENLDRENESDLKFETLTDEVLPEVPQLGKLIMDSKMYKYLNAESDELIETTCKNYTKVLEKDGVEFHKRLRLSIARALRKGTGYNYEVSEYQHIGTEIPIFNPHVMVKKTQDPDHRYRLVSTQADFIGIARAKLTEGLPQNFLVMGEFKTLMEKDNAARRVTLDRTFFQVLTNAFLFEMMTGTCPDVVMVCFLQRRRRKYHRTNLHAGLYIKNALHDNSAFGRALRRIRAMVTTNIRLTRNNKTLDVDFLYVDDKHVISKKYNDPQSLPTTPVLFNKKKLETSFWFGYPNIRMNLRPSSSNETYMTRALSETPIVAKQRKHDTGYDNLSVAVNNLWSGTQIVTYSNKTETVIVNKVDARENFQDSFDWDNITFESRDFLKESKDGVLQINDDAEEPLPDNHVGKVVLNYLLKEVEPRGQDALSQRHYHHNVQNSAFSDYRLVKTGSNDVYEIRDTKNNKEPMTYWDVFRAWCEDNDFTKRFVADILATFGRETRRSNYDGKFFSWKIMPFSYDTIKKAAYQHTFKMINDTECRPDLSETEAQVYDKRLKSAKNNGFTSFTARSKQTVFVGTTCLEEKLTLVQFLKSDDQRKNDIFTEIATIVYEKINEKSLVGTRLVPATNSTLDVSVEDHAQGNRFNVAIKIIDPLETNDRDENDGDNTADELINNQENSNDNDMADEPSNVQENSGDNDTADELNAGEREQDDDDNASVNFNPPDNVPFLEQQDVVQNIGRHIEDLRNMRDNINGEDEIAAVNINLAIQYLNNLIQVAPQQQQQQFQELPAPADDGNQGANFAFRDRPPQFDRRVYPANEPEINKTWRLILNEKVHAAALNIHEMLLLTNPVVEGNVRYDRADGQQVHQKLSTLFDGNIPTTNVPRLFGTAEAVILEREDDDEERREAKRTESEYIEILRACQRLVNERIFVNVLMSEAGDTVRGYDKNELAQRFTHLSQRTYWHIRNLEEASNDVEIDNITEKILNHFD